MIRLIFSVTFAALSALALSHALASQGATMPPSLRLVPYGGTRRGLPEPSLN